MNVNEAVKLYEGIAATQSSHAWKSWCRHWAGVWGDRKLSSISAGEINQHIAQRRKEGKTEATIRSQINTLKQLFKVAGVPFPEVAKTKVNNDRVRSFLGDEESRLKAVMHPDDWAIVELAKSTGLRSFELWNLKKEDVDMANGIIHVRQGKGGKSRRVPIGKTARKALKALLASRSKWVVVPRGHENYTSRKASCHMFKERVWRPALRAAGIEDFRFHDLRHEFCTRLVRAGHSLYIVQRAAGHSTPIMTQRYAHISDYDLKKAVAAL